MRRRRLVRRLPELLRDAQLRIPAGRIYVFVFGTAGGVWNPTSTLNFSRIEHTQLDLKYNNQSTDIKPSDIILFVESYNLLVVKSGMAFGKFL